MKCAVTDRKLVPGDPLYVASIDGAIYACTLSQEALRRIEGLRNDGGYNYFGHVNVFQASCPAVNGKLHRTRLSYQKHLFSISRAEAIRLLPKRVFSYLNVGLPEGLRESAA